MKNIVIFGNIVLSASLTGVVQHAKVRKPSNQLCGIDFWNEDPDPVVKLWLHMDSVWISEL